MSLIALILAVLVSSTFQTSRARGGPPKDYLDPEAYIIYSTILPSSWIIKHGNAKHLVILRETRVFEMCLRPEKEFEERVGPAIKDYTRVNESLWLLQEKFELAPSYELVSHEQLTLILGKGDWKGFGAYYPDSKGWLELSAVGFNEDKTVAVVYMGHYCGELCGGGGFHVLQKKDGKWVPLDLKGASCAWVS